MALVALTAALYGSVVRQWWLADDFFNLRWVRAWRPADYLLNPVVWRQLPFRTVTPLLFASHDLDLALFATDPRGYYVHHLALLALSAVAFYAVLRMWVEAHWALMGAVLFLAGAPVASTASLLMVRAYLECLLWALLAVLCWVASLRRTSPSRGWALAVLSATFWLISLLGKEIVAPLLVVLPLLPVGDLRARLRRLSPHLVVAGLYVVYRLRMLGTFAGGYGWAPEPSDWPRLTLKLPVRIGEELLGTPSAAAGIALAVVIAGAGLMLVRGGRAVAILTLGVVGAMLPVLPVASEVEPRYALAAWIVLVLAFVLGVRSYRLVSWLGPLAVVALLVANRQSWREIESRAQRMSAENRAVLGFAAGEVLRAPAGPPASLRELRSFASELLGRRVQGGWFYDDVYLCTAGAAARRFWEWDPSQHRLAEVTPRIAGMRRSACSPALLAKPLSASFQRTGRVLRWKLGPYEAGRWRFVFADGVEAFDVPRRGGFQIGEIGELVVRVSYESPAGWSAYSPPLRMDFRRRDRYEWRRPPA